MKNYKNRPRIFKNAWFTRFAVKEKISDAQLLEAVERAEKGLIDADLGGHIIKQRIARPGQGKSGGYRSIIIYKQGDKAFFVYGFAKNERDNLDRQETETYKKAAKELLALSDAQIKKLIEKHALIEVKYEQQEEI
ncbi:MAG: type II toxin-antitoxin system RelE/ParE family toxin [Pseudomonadota bacterium]